MNMTFIRNCCEKMWPCDSCIIWWIEFTVSDLSQEYLVMWCDFINCVSLSSYRFFTWSANRVCLCMPMAVAVTVCNCVNIMQMHYIIRVKKEILCSSKMIFHIVWKYSQVNCTHIWMRCACEFCIKNKIKTRNNKNIQVFRQTCVWLEYPKKLYNFKWARMGSLCIGRAHVRIH